MMDDLFAEDLEELAQFIPPVPADVETPINIPDEMVHSEINQHLLSFYQHTAGMINGALYTVREAYEDDKTIRVPEVRAADNTLAAINRQAASVRALFIQAAQAGEAVFRIPEEYIDRLKFLEVDWPSPDALQEEGAADVAGDEEAAADVAGDEEAADGAGDEEGAADGAGDEEEAADGAGDEEEAADGAGDEEEAADGAGDEEAAADGAGDEEAAADVAGDEEEAADGAGDDEAAADGAGDDEAAADSAEDEAGLLCSRCALAVAAAAAAAAVIIWIML